MHQRHRLTPVAFLFADGVDGIEVEIRSVFGAEEALFEVGLTGFLDVGRQGVLRDREQACIISCHMRTAGWQRSNRHSGSVVRQGQRRVALGAAFMDRQ